MTRRGNGDHVIGLEERSRRVGLFCCYVSGNKTRVVQIGQGTPKLLLYLRECFPDCDSLHSLHLLPRPPLVRRRELATVRARIFLLARRVGRGPFSGAKVPLEL